MSSVPVWFSLGILGGLSANVGLMQLNNMHKGCANVCTLCQFLFGLSQTLLSPGKRRLLFDASARRIPLGFHLIFAGMFFLGPFLGNKSTAITNADFYPVFLVVRSCGTVSSMLLGWLFAGKKYNVKQVLGVAAITVGAVVTTYGCYVAGQQAATLAAELAAAAAAPKGRGRRGKQAVVESAPASEVTSVPMFIVGCGLLLANLLVDSGNGVLQAHVFAPLKKVDDDAKAKTKGKAASAVPSVVDEAVVMMSAIGTVLMALVAGSEVWTFLAKWIAAPTPYVAMGVVTLPSLELAFLAINFYGNWNSKKIQTWLNANSSAVISSLVPMLYRLISTVVSTQIFKGAPLPAFTWAGVALVFGGSVFYMLASKGKATADVVLVGCGLPARGMGWYHALQMVEGEIPSANLTDVVEPWFLGGGKDSPGGKAFAALVKEWEPKGVKFHASVSSVAAPAAGKQKVALISGRTADNPKLLKEVIGAGCTCVYLEKPGAPSVPELEEMARFAKSKGIPVYMGYNKNVTKYVTDALAAEASAGPGASTAFYHNNAYQKKELPECFERNAEGMLKNMAVHELALLVTYYGVKGDNIKTVTPDKAYSSCQTLKGPSKGASFTDFDAIGFTLTTTEGKSVSVYADRCGDAGGGGFAEAVVKDASGKEVARTKTPDAALVKVVKAKQKAHPDWMPYFHLQHDDYVTLKERVCAAVVSGGVPEGVATIDVATETLKVAEYLTPTLEKALTSYLSF